MLLTEWGYEMNAIKVEKGIDMPIETERVIYPYDRMEVGDSFLVNDEGKNAMVKVCARNKRVGEKLGMKFVAKKVDGGVRVWRKG